MTVLRRRMLALIGGGTVLAAGGSAARFLGTRTPERALAPWEVAGTYAEPRRRALSYAILAPNAHNRQPWVAELVGTNRVRIHRDVAIDLPMTDPLGRQIAISMGCFLELFEIAAAETGHAVETVAARGPAPAGLELIADLRLVADGAAPDPLFAAVLDRRSCKEPFEDRPIPEAARAALAKTAEIVTEPGRVAALRDLTWAAWLTEARTPRTHKESVDLMRIGRREIEARPDGIDLGGPLLESLALVGMLSREGQLDPDSTGYRQGVDMYRAMLAATPAYAAITMPGDTRADRLEAGRRWLRLNLTTTALGLSLHPVSQALQEFPEMAPHLAAAHRLLAPAGGTVQMLGRLGYGPRTPRTPRWPLEAKIADGIATA